MSKHCLPGTHLRKKELMPLGHLSTTNFFNSPSSDELPSFNNALKKINQRNIKLKILLIGIFVVSIFSVICYFIARQNDIGIIVFVVLNFILCCIVAGLAPSYNNFDEKKFHRREYHEIKNDTEF